MLGLVITKAIRLTSKALFPHHPPGEAIQYLLNILFEFTKSNLLPLNTVTTEKKALMFRFIFCLSEKIAEKKANQDNFIPIQYVNMTPNTLVMQNQGLK